MRTLLLALLVAALPAIGASAQQTAIEQMNQPGPEAARLAQRTGVWDVTITLRPAPDAKPMVWNNLIAERRMVGVFLEETIRPAPGSQQADFRRISYLTYNRVEGRWQYVSLDTRFPAGIMPAYSVDRQSPEHVVLEFESLAFPGLGETVDGWMLRSSYAITFEDNDHELARQYWTRANGSGERWLGVEHRYVRQRRGK